MIESIKTDDRKWAEEVSEKIKDKMHAVAERNREKIPCKSVDGVYDDQSDESIGSWTNGFWSGMMWQLYHGTGDELYREIAEKTELKMDRALMSRHSMDHDSGFRWLLSAVADYRVTGSEASFNRGVLAADNLAGRLNPAGKFIRAWNDWGGEEPGTKAGWAIIDCMMNLPLLYWAYEELHDPRYLQIGKLHANTAQRYFIREDGSANHIVCFDPVSGEYKGTIGGQGYGEGSSWTRGQGWAIYGFMLSYIHTGEESYLETAKRAADYFIANIPEDNLIPIDFRQPADCKLEDSSAAAIAACGLIEIAGQLEKKGEPGKAEAHIYLNAALRILKTLDKQRCCWDAEMDPILEKCSEAYHSETGREITLIFGDYYFMEAIWKLTGEEVFCW